MSQICFQPNPTQRVCVTVNPIASVPPPITPSDPNLINVWNGAVSEVVRKRQVTPAQAAVFLAPYWSANGFNVDVPLDTTFSFGSFLGNAASGAIKGFQTGITIGSALLQAAL